MRVPVGFTLATALALLALVGLGTWQLQRLAWKRDLIATMEARLSAPTVPLAGLTDSGDVEYRRVRVSGRLLHGRAFFVLAIGPQGAGGYRVLTPLERDGGGPVLVDRGWVPYDRAAWQEPGRRAERFSHPDGTVTVSGPLRRPHRGWGQSDQAPERNEWPGVDLAVMARQAGLPAFFPYVLEQNGDGGDGDPQAERTPPVLANHHLGYALTWYGLALALVVIYGLRLRKAVPAAASPPASSAAAPRPPDAAPP